MESWEGAEKDSARGRGEGLEKKKKPAQEA
jgi:hypothetical protein